MVLRCAGKVFALVMVVALSLGAVTASGLMQTASAQEQAEQANRAQDIIRTTMSPFCPGRTLEACPSPYAGEWREDVRQWVAEGVSTQEIRDRLKQRMPDKDLTGAPSTMLDSILPALVSVVAVVVLVFLLRNLLRKEPKSSEDTSRTQRATRKSDEALDQELDDELDQLDD